LELPAAPGEWLNHHFDHQTAKRIWRLVLRIVVYFFLVLAVTGFLGILTIHIAALAGVTAPSVILKVVIPGLFFVWVPAIFVSSHLSKEFKQDHLWRATLRGCPKWMQTALWVISGYGFLGTFLFPLLFGGNIDAYGGSVKGMSGFMMAFYAMAVCVLYSATRVEEFDRNRCCPNGHHVSPVARFCEDCGSPVTDNADTVEQL
jgi:nitrate/nitrite transporter NarK